ncbi:pyridoxamine 5'-phosphate oxidase [Flavivirga aquatica]|uniref:Pyridoxamine 5'-phosphate oxidase n=1 Tax=Flavivirga aquatica TaxID=1849968 RepID=A0A1E5SJ19_9FLAO|nr:pyridoxamine 5'-phosphate oxidase [Flavivirga aquatica]OEJ99110.1 pyridoxamine 5'-phosphate oxidase [Flavivirga aquatica]
MGPNKNIEADYNPMQQFQKWFYEADNLYHEREPNAMSITTIGIDNYPKSRMVLLKKYTWEGFVFYTNYKSDKAIAININPKVNILFNWGNSGRMIQVYGIASKITRTESENYFDLRPRGSKISAWASQQSKPVASRIVLEKQLETYERQFKNKEIPKPEYWGGFIVKPKEFHFFEANFGGIRLHESYRLQEDYSWSKNTELNLTIH